MPTNMEAIHNTLANKRAEFSRRCAQVQQGAQDVLNAFAEIGFQALSEEQKKTHVIVTESVPMSPDPENTSRPFYMFALKSQYLGDFEADIDNDRIYGVGGSALSMFPWNINYDEAEVFVFCYDFVTRQAQWIDPRDILRVSGYVEKVTETGIDDLVKLSPDGILRYPGSDLEHQRSEQPKAAAPFSM